MKLTDLQSREKWIELEKEINRRSGLQASVFDIDGIRITDYKSWANRLCPEIKATDRGQSYICAVAHQNLAVQAQKTHLPVVEECDAVFVSPAVNVREYGSTPGRTEDKEHGHMKHEWERSKATDTGVCCHMIQRYHLRVPP